MSEKREEFRIGSVGFVYPNIKGITKDEFTSRYGEGTQANLNKTQQEGVRKGLKTWLDNKKEAIANANKTETAKPSKQDRKKVVSAKVAKQKKINAAKKDK